MKVVYDPLYPFHVIELEQSLDLNALNAPLIEDDKGKVSTSLATHE